MLSGIGSLGGTSVSVYNLLLSRGAGRCLATARAVERRPQMDGLFGAEGSLIVRFVVAFVIVLALIGADVLAHPPLRRRRASAPPRSAAASRGSP